jgi:fibronectin type 3 domain-containing protein
MWNDNSSNEDYFQIEKSKVGTSVSSLIWIPRNTNMYLDVKIEDKAVYQYKVRALNQYGSSAFSNVVTVIAEGIPLPPPK